MFNLLHDAQLSSNGPRRYRLKLVDIDPFSSDDDSPFDSLFSFTASPVESPSYSVTAFSPRQISRPTPLSLGLPSNLSQISFFSPLSPEFTVVRPFGLSAGGSGDKVDRWIHGSAPGSGGLDPPLMTPLVFDNKPHELWDDGGQSDWREIVDRFLQYADGEDESPFPPTPDPARQGY